MLWGGLVEIDVVASFVARQLARRDRSALAKQAKAHDSALPASDPRGPPPLDVHWLVRVQPRCDGDECGADTGAQRGFDDRSEQR